MRPWWSMPVTIIPLEAASVLGLLVCHPLGRLVAGAAGHPVVEVAAWFAHGECSDVAPPSHRSAANGSCVSAMSRVIHPTWSPHMIASTGYGWPAERFPARLGTLAGGESVPHRSPRRG